MKIIDVYTKYNAPPVLRNHMINVAKVAMYILDHWKGPKIDRKMMILLCLVHDLGNIVRIDFNKQFGPKKEWLDIKFWNERKEDIINKYGNDDDSVTAKILNEIGVDDEISNIIFEKRFKNSIKIYTSKNWLLKLLLYSDLRVLPTGIGTLQERLDEVVSRRSDLSNRPDIENLIEANFLIEKDLQKYVSVPLDTINDESIKNYGEELLNYEI